MTTPERGAIRRVTPDLGNGNSGYFKLSKPRLASWQDGNEIARTALVIFELRHSFQLILGGVKHRMIRVPLLVCSPNRSSSGGGGSTCRSSCRSVRCRSRVAVDL